MKKVIFVGAGEYAESVYDSMAKEEYDLMEITPKKERPMMVDIRR